MKQRSLWMFLFAVTAFVAGLTWLFQLRIGRGDVFPAYSTLRADPLGTRAVFDALQELPGLQIERSLKPLEKIAEQPARTLVFVGMRPDTWESFSVEEANALDRAALAGSRIVVVFKAQRPGILDEIAEEKKAAEERRKAEEAAAKKAKEKREGAKEKDADKTEPENPRSPRNDEEKVKTPKREYAGWERRWGVEIRDRWIMDRGQGALKSADAAAELPAQVRWKSDLYFHLPQGADWTVLYSRGGSPVMVEMTRGRGSVVLATDAYFLSNEAMQKDRAPELIAWLIGKSARVEFVETHLGLTEDVGIARLARRYGLAGAFFMLLLLTALFVWQRMALFVPPAPEMTETSLTYHPSAGLEALLRRALPANKLVETCVAEWTRTVRAGAGDKARVAAVPLKPKASPADNYNAIVRALKRR